MTNTKAISPYYDSRTDNRQVIRTGLICLVVAVVAIAPPRIGAQESAQDSGSPAPESAAAAESSLPAGASAATEASPVVAPPSGSASVSDGTVWDRAVEAIQYQRNEEAIPLLRVAVQQDPQHEVEATRLLAHALEQTGKVADAERVLRERLTEDTIQPQGRSVIAFDLAALLGRTDRKEEAREMYGVALAADGAFAPAYLNRANLRVETGLYGEAIGDYELFLALRPRSNQRPQVEEMIALLTEELEAERIRREEEERRLAAEEEARRAAEEERREREEEERRRAEERRQQMLDSVLQSLGNVEDETESFELENEEIREYEEELDILD